MQDGLVDRYFNRKLSSHLTRWLMKTPATPNQITILSFLVGLLSAFFFWRGGYANGLIGSVVFQASAVLDCCDGEIARLKSLQSRLGQWLDLVCDNIVHVAIFLAIAWSFYASHSHAGYLALGGLASLGSALSLRFVLLSSRSKGGGTRDQGLRKAADRLTNRDFSVILFLFALLGRLDWFLWLAALGSNLFWMVVWWLYRREARLSPLKS